MTISTTTRKTTPVVGNNIATVFPFAFKVFDKTDLQLVDTLISTGVGTTLVLDSDYSVTLNTDQNANPGGTCTYPLVGAPMAPTHSLIIVSAIAELQALNLPANGGQWLATVVEDALDRNLAISQQLDEKASRSLRFPVQDTSIGTELPAAAGRAGLYLAFDGSGNPIATVGTASSPVSAAMTPVVSAATLALGRAALGVDATGVNIPKTIVTAKGSLIGSTGSGAPVEHAVGSDGSVLFPSSTAADGLVWAKMGCAMFNGTIEPTVASNVLTIALKTDSGADPSAASPVFVAFRDPSLTSGQYSGLKIIAALTLTVPNTATLGTANGVLARLYVGIFNDAGTPRLSVWNPLSGVNLLAVQDNQIASAVLLDTAADNAQVIYAGATVTSKAHRVIGAIEISEATAGTWATAATKKSTLMPWDKRTGDVVQVLITQTSAVATGTTTTPLDDTIPQITEGNEFMTRTITPSSAINPIMVDTAAMVSNSVGNNFTMALHQDAIANALAATIANQVTATVMTQIGLKSIQAPATVSQITYRTRIGGNAAGTTTVNGAAAARLMGGVGVSYLQVQEIQA